MHEIYEFGLQVIHCGNLGEKHVCQDNKPVCKERWRGVHCELPVCPNKCSEPQDHGRCHANFGQCVCKEGFVGEDCSIIQEDHQVSQDRFLFSFTLAFVLKVEELLKVSEILLLSMAALGCKLRNGFNCLQFIILYHRLS